MNFSNALMVSILIATGACLDPFSPPDGTYSFVPPANYGAAWESVEDCSGLRGDFRRIQWFIVPATSFFCGEDSPCDGTWRSPHSIYLAEQVAFDSANGYFTVRHEMLHDLLGGGADPPPV